MTAFLLAILPISLFNFSTSQILSNIPTPVSSLEIAADSSFSNKTQNFSPNQTIYVQTSANIDGSDKKILNVRDNSYNLLTTYQLNETGANPYLFTVSFPAPSSAGTYSLEVDIESSGSVTSLVQTINVSGSPQDNSQSKVQIKNEINTNTQIQGENPLPSKSPDSSKTPIPSSLPKNHAGFFGSAWEKVTSFFSSIFHKLTF